MPSVQASIPTRIDLAGGTIDLWPIHCVLNNPTTVNIGVTLPATVDVTLSQDGNFHFSSIDQSLSQNGTLNELVASTSLPLLGILLGTVWSADLPPISITTSAKSPAGAGLGGSSCLGIAVAAALFRLRKILGGNDIENEETLVRTVQDAEAKLIHAPTGCQDYWGGVRGNINVLRYPYGRTVVETRPHSSINGLNESLIVCYSGKSRQSAINNWEIFKRVFDRDITLLKNLNDISALANACGNSILNDDLSSALKFSSDEWNLRKKLWPNIETSETKGIDVAARKAGALFSRVCGAGGGGVMAIFAEKGRRNDVAAAASAAGGTILQASISSQGLRINEL